MALTCVECGCGVVARMVTLATRGLRVGKGPSRVVSLPPVGPIIVCTLEEKGEELWPWKLKACHWSPYLKPCLLSTLPLSASPQCFISPNILGCAWDRLQESALGRRGLGLWDTNGLELPSFLYQLNGGSTHSESWRTVLKGKLMICFGKWEQNQRSYRVLEGEGESYLS